MHKKNTPSLPSGSTIGILGGGQLGRMIALAAAKLGVKSHIYCPDPNSPAFDVTPLKTVAAYDDETALKIFAESVDLVTYEFENVPMRTAEFIEKFAPLAPGVKPLAISQDRVLEKTFLSQIGIAVAPWKPVTSLEDLHAAIAEIGTPSVLKTATLGYDGKGQRKIAIPNDAESAFAELKSDHLVLEGFIPFEREISVVVARNADGAVAAYDPAENVHENHILKTSTVPASIDAATAQTAVSIAGKIAESLDYHGVLGVEFFVVSDSDTHLLVNEIAPRVHNSGHWTEAACLTDQFEQHVRAILNWPLGSPARHADVVMENLLGDEIFTVPDLVASGAQPHVYGKLEARPGRKMGHINRLKQK